MGIISEFAPLLTILVEASFFLWTEAGSTFTLKPLERKQRQQTCHRQLHRLPGDFSSVIFAQMSFGWMDSFPLSAKSCLGVGELIGEWKEEVGKR